MYKKIIHSTIRNVEIDPSILFSIKMRSFILFVTNRHTGMKDLKNFGCTPWLMMDNFSSPPFANKIEKSEAKEQKIQNSISIQAKKKKIWSGSSSYLNNEYHPSVYRVERAAHRR